MLSVLKRHEIGLLLRAGHEQKEVAEFVGVSERTVRRVAREGAMSLVAEAVEGVSRRLGRPSKTEEFRGRIVALLKEEPDLLSVEILRRARLAGYTRSQERPLRADRLGSPCRGTRDDAFRGAARGVLAARLRAGGRRYLDGRIERVHFFASRLKWSRWVEVTLVEDETAESLIRTLLEHFVGFGGVPLCAVFDRPKTVALKWKRNGEVTEWNPVFAYAALEIGFTAEVCWPYQPQQKGAVENLGAKNGDVPRLLERFHHRFGEGKKSRSGHGKAGGR